VCSGKNIEFVKKLGADEVIDYTQDDWSEVLADQKIDVIYDCIGGEDVWPKAQKILAPSGRFVTIAGDKQQKLTPGVILKAAGTMINRKFWGMTNSSPSWSQITARSNWNQLQILSDMVEEGSIVPTVAKVYPLRKTAKAFKYNMTSRTVGKIAIHVCGECDELADTSSSSEEEQKEEEAGKEKDKEERSSSSKEEQKEEQPQEQNESSSSSEDEEEKKEEKDSSSSSSDQEN